MGASVLGLYAVRSGDKNRLDACFAVGCHYDCAKSLDNLSTKYLGFYDYFLGYFIKLRMTEPCIEYDKLIQKK
jgi:predicted alpha/beta-fold hydrolase